MMYKKLLDYGGKGFLFVEDLANQIFTPRYNPFYYLGAIAIFFLWLLLVSGIYLFIFYSIGEPYESVRRMTEVQWYAGGIMRSVHRYSADGLILTSLLHLIRVFLTDRYRYWRWLAWVSGIAFLIAIWVTGIIGYWLVWDRRAQLIAQLTAKFLDFLPIFGEPLAMSFTTDKLVTGLFFFMALFIHLFIPVLLFMILWVHVMRISKPVINPPVVISVFTGSAILILSIVKPAVSLLPATSDKIITAISFDWFYLFLYPLINNLPEWASWALVSLGVAFFTGMPWYIRSKRPEAAGIIAENCTGCSQCFKDCPYDAIHMRPRTDDRPYELEAVVMNNRCASCGICVGSCSFDGVTMPDMGGSKDIIVEIRKVLKNVTRGAEPVILLMGCSFGETVLPFKGRDRVGMGFSGDNYHPSETIRFINLPCIGMIHPSWIGTALDAGADGVVISGCQMGDCHYRQGNAWLEERLSRERAPVLNGSADRSKIRLFWFSALQTDMLLKEVRKFQEELKVQVNSAGLNGRHSIAGISSKTRGAVKNHRALKLGWKTAIAPLVILIPAVLLMYFSDAPYRFSNTEDSMLKLSIRHLSKRVTECDEFTKLNQEAERYREQLRNTDRAKMKLNGIEGCSRDRHGVYVELFIDNEKSLGRLYEAGGLKNDGPSFVYEELMVRPGTLRIEVRLSDSGRKDRFDYSFAKELQFEKGVIKVIGFDESNGGMALNAQPIIN